MLFKKLLLFKNAELSTKQTTQTTTKTTRGPMKATTKKTRKTKQQETREAGDSSDDEEEKQLREELDLLFPTQERLNEPLPPRDSIAYEKKPLRAQPKRLTLRHTCPTRRDEMVRKLCAGIQAKLMLRFSQSTWDRRTYLHNTVCHFSENMNLELSEKTILLALEWISASVTAGTLLTYATTLRAMFPAHGGETLDAYIQSLRKLSAKVPIRQAPPLTRAQFDQLMQILPEHVKWAFWVAWKTASRWGECRLLSNKNTSFTALADEVVIDFKELTKGSATRPFRMDLIVLIKDDPQRISDFRRYLAKLRTAPLTTWTTTHLTTFLRNTFPGSQLSAHSPKRGAMQLVMEAAAAGLIPLGLAAQIAKHLGGQVVLPDTTVRYTTDRVALARANGSGSVTRLL